MKKSKEFPKTLRVGFVGFGRMGSALASGAIGSGAVKARQICAFDPDPVCRRRMKKMQCRPAASLAELAGFGQLIFLCVKPQQMGETLAAIRAPAPGAVKGKCFVSIAAGIPLARLERELGEDAAVIRVMPNTPALLRAGMSALSLGAKATRRHEALVRIILSSVGDVVTLSDSAMDAVTAVSGSGPAYVFYLAESMIGAGVKLGLGRETARRLVHQTIYGAGRMLAEREEPADELRRQVTSPGGTTAAAMTEFEARGFMPIVQAALTKAAERSKELSNA